MWLICVGVAYAAHTACLLAYAAHTARLLFTIGARGWLVSLTNSPAETLQSILQMM
jgi:hypothetical protein